MFPCMHIYYLLYYLATLTFLDFFIGLSSSEDDSGARLRLVLLSLFLDWRWPHAEQMTPSLGQPAG